MAQTLGEGIGCVIALAQVLAVGVGLTATNQVLQVLLVGAA